MLVSLNPVDAVKSLSSYLETRFGAGHDSAQRPAIAQWLEAWHCNVDARQTGGTAGLQKRGASPQKRFRSGSSAAQLRGQCCWTRPMWHMVAVLRPVEPSKLKIPQLLSIVIGRWWCCWNPVTMQRVPCAGAPNLIDFEIGLPATNGAVLQSSPRWCCWTRCTTPMGPCVGARAACHASCSWTRRRGTCGGRRSRRRFRARPSFCCTTARTTLPVGVLLRHSMAASLGPKWNKVE